MKQDSKHAKFTDLAALLVFGLFALCVLLVLLTGADVYGKLVDRGQSDHARRTATQYLSTRVHQADCSGAFSVEEFESLDALVFREQIGGQSYLTRVYCYDGYLYELFIAEGGSFSPEDGEKLVEAKALSVALEDGLLSARITFPDGSFRDITLYLRSGEGSP